MRWYAYTVCLEYFFGHKLDRLRRLHSLFNPLAVFVSSCYVFAQVSVLGSSGVAQSVAVFTNMHYSWLQYALWAHIIVLCVEYEKNRIVSVAPTSSRFVIDKQKCSYVCLDSTVKDGVNEFQIMQRFIGLMTRLDCKLRIYIFSILKQISC